MTLDKALEEALEEVVCEAGQPETVARRLIAWLREMSTGEMTKEDSARRLKAARETLDLGSNHAD